jgi:hypothetical protein
VTIARAITAPCTSSASATAAMQPLFEPGHHERLQRDDDEQRVRDERDRDVDGRPRLAGERHRMRCGGDRRQQRAGGGDREHDRGDCGKRAQHAGEPRGEHREPRGQRQRVDEREVEPRRAHDRLPDRDRVQREREREEHGAGVARARGSLAGARPPHPGGGAVERRDERVQ